MNRCLAIATLSLHEIGILTFAIFTCLYPWYSAVMIIGAPYYISMPYSCFHQYSRLTLFHIILTIIYCIIIIPCAYIQTILQDNVPKITMTSSILTSIFVALFVILFVRVQKIYPFYSYRTIPDFSDRI